MLTTKPTAIDLFAGAGGFSLGFEMAGFSVPLAIEVDAWASDTLGYNHPDMTVIRGDIRDFNTIDVVKKICLVQPSYFLLSSLPLCFV